MTRRALSLAFALLATQPVAAVAKRPLAKPVSKGAKKPARPVPHRVPPGMSELVDATATRGFLDLGTEGGIAVGNRLNIVRGGRIIGACLVDSAAPHHASCKGAGLHVGDLFRTPPAPPRPAGPPGQADPPLPTVELKRRHEVLAKAAPADAFAFEGTRSVGLRRLRSDLAIRQGTWSVPGQVGATYNRQSVDVAVRGAELFAGTRLYLDISALHQSPPDDAQFRANVPTQLYVWEAAVAHRDEVGALAISGGRLWAWNAPGLPILDGVQAGWRTSGGGGEFGVFGGEVPDPVTTGELFKRPLGGAYWAFDYHGDGVLTVMHQEGRADVANTPEIGTRIEAEGLARFEFGKVLRLNADLGAGAGGATRVDIVELDFDAHPVDGLSFSGGYHYQGTQSELTAINLTGYQGPFQRGDLAAHYQPSTSWGASVSGGFADDFFNGEHRYFVGPQFDLPTLFGPYAGMSIGYQEERGYVFGRTAYVQAQVTPDSTFRIWGRVGWMQDYADDIGLLDFHNDLALSTYVTAQLTSFLEAQTGVTLRADIDDPGPVGGIISIALRGHL